MEKRREKEGGNIHKPEVFPLFMESLETPVGNEKYKVKLRGY